MAAAVTGLRASYHRLLDRIELMLPPRFRPFYNHPAGNGGGRRGEGVGRGEQLLGAGSPQRGVGAAWRGASLQGSVAARGELWQRCLSRRQAARGSRGTRDKAVASHRPALGSRAPHP